jgi:hypothetical protein
MRWWWMPSISRPRPSACATWVCLSADFDRAAGDRTARCSGA